MKKTTVQTKKRDRALSLLLAAIMILSVIPAVGLSAFAETLGPVLVQLSGGYSQRHTVANYQSAYAGSGYQYGMAAYAVPMDGSSGNPDICVPGLSSADNMVPQGLTYWAAKNWILISAYHNGGSNASCVFALRADTGAFVAQFNLKTASNGNITDHVSGIACSANNLYVASTGSTMSYIPLSQLDVAEGTVRDVCYTGTVNLNLELNSANTSYASIGDGILWTGNFYIEGDSNYGTKANADSGTMMLGYDLSGYPDSAAEWAALQSLAGNPSYCIPLDAYGINKVQCATVKNGFCYVGTSYGRTNDSQMYIFNVNLTSAQGTITVNGHVKPRIILADQRVYAHLPMTEGLMIYNGCMWNIFESAAYLYNGAGSLSKNPTDVLWRFDISTLLGIDRENDDEEAAAGDDQYKAAGVSCGDLTFVVPEVIYLTPTTNDSSSFQYYFNNAADGSVVTAYGTTGKIYYTYSGASSATLSYKFYNDNLTKELSGGSVSLSSATIYSGNAGVNITGGTSPSISGGGSSYIQWELTYTDGTDGKTKKAYAYTYVYDNNVSSHNNVVADQVFQLVTASRKKNREILNWAIWISGISGIESYPGDRQDKYVNCRYAYPPLTTSSIELKSGSSTDPSNSDTIDGCYVEAAGNMGYTGYWWKDGGSSSGTERTQISYYKAFLNVDTSRITNTSQIPNLKVGLDIFENWGGENDGTNTWGLGYYASGDGENQTNLISQTSSSGNNDNRVKGRVSGNIKTLSIDLSSLASAKTYILQSRGTSRNAGYEVDTKIKLFFDIVPTNKANLRTAVRNATEAMAKLGVNGASHGKLTSLYFKSDSDYRWVAFQHAYKNAVMALTRPDGSADQAIIDALNDALAALCTHVTYDHNGGTVTGATETAYVTVGTGQTGTVTPGGTGTRTGYTFDGWSTGSTAATGSATVTVGYNDTVYAVWKPIPYTITFKNGSATLQSSAWNYGTTPVYSGSTPAKAYDSAKHYTFSGWSPAIVTVTAAATYTAQFTGTNHSYTSSVTAPPTCTAAGTTTYTCSCGYSYTDPTIPVATGHSWSAWTPVDAQNAHRVCLFCGREEAKQITCNDSFVVDSALMLDVLENDLNGTGSQPGSGLTLKTQNGITGLSSAGVSVSVTNNRVALVPQGLLTDTLTFTYTALYDGAEYTADVTVIPVSNVYLEESVFTFEDSPDGFITWQTAGTACEPVFDSLLSGDADQGAGSAYNSANSSTYSMGSAKYAVVSSAHPMGATATFSFTGTGFELFTVTDNRCGTVIVTVSGGNLKKDIKRIHNAFLGYSYDSATGWTVSTEAADEALYQVPVISETGLAYGSYTVTVEPRYTTMYDVIDPCRFYIDAVRVYDPIDPSGIQAGTELYNNYVDNLEFDAHYQKLRDVLLAADAFDVHGSGLTDVADGIAFVTIDGYQSHSANLAALQTYKEIGPKNEVYLEPDEGIAFYMTTGGGAIPAKLCVGMKLLRPGAGTLEVNGTEYHVDCATELYRRIPIAAGGWTNNGDGTYTTVNPIVIVNTSSDGSIVSLTKLKWSFGAREATKSPAERALKFSFSRSALDTLALTAPNECEGPLDAGAVTVTWDKDTFELGETATLTITAPAAFMRAFVDGEEIAGYEELADGRRQWTYVVTAQELGVLPADVTLEDANEYRTGALKAPQLTATEPTVELEESAIAWENDGIALGDKATLKVTVSANVVRVTVNGEEITLFELQEDGSKVFTWTVTPETAGEHRYTVSAAESHGYASETLYTPALTVSEPPIQEPADGGHLSFRVLLQAILNFFHKVLDFFKLKV